MFQRAESAALFAASTFAYFHLGYSLPVYILLLFVFDISMIGYVKNPKLGAFTYNLGHSLIAPLAVLLVAWTNNSETAIGISLIWLAHIGLDRFAGYGLKLTSGFKNTHLGNIGKS